MSKLAHLNIPGPTITALTEPFWTAASKGFLSIQQCRACKQFVFYPRALCPFCWNTSLDWKTVSGAGQVKSHTKIWKPGHPGWAPVTPYIVGLVELAEGPTMLSHILTDSNAISIGDPLRFTPTDVGGRVLPCFKFA